jgi:hypothetical protein
MSLFKRDLFSTFFIMMKVIILAALLLMGHKSWAQIRDFKTTRLMSTAGTGVASILSTEAAILNPASSTFFEGSSASYQSYKTSLQHKDDGRDSLADPFPKSNRSQGIFLADHTGTVKGGVAHIMQDENNLERQRYVLHGAAPMGPTTSIGVSYNYIQDTLPRGARDRHKIHHQASIGFTQIVDEDTIVGLIVQDPTRTTPGEERVIAGFQYTLADRFTLLGDVGAQYTKDTSKNYLWRGAIQMNIFSDFFLRGGQFYDNIKKLKGTGWGVGWIGPRFGVEFGQLFSEQFDSGFYVYKDERIVDSALSVIIKF